VLPTSARVHPRACGGETFEYFHSGRQVGVNADFKLTLPQFWCNLAVGWRNLHESREPLCDCFAWSFAVCGDFFEVAVWSFGIRSFRQHTLPSPSSVQRPTPHVLRAAASPAAGTAAIPGS